METLTLIFYGFGAILNFPTILAIILGVTMGLIVGAIPGITIVTGIALFLPITFSFPPEIGINFLVGIYVGGAYGGSITAILIRTPGGPSNVVTTFDGYPLTQQGKAGDALYMALFASVVGGIFGSLILFTLAPYVANFALRFGPAEYFTLTIFGMSIITSISGKSIIKGLLAALTGVLLSLVGMDAFTAVPRFTFGSIILFSGFNPVAVLIGIFAVSEVLYQVRHTSTINSSKLLISSFARTYIPIKEALRHFGTLIRSSAIGAFVGVIPGPGGGIAALIAYDTTKRLSKNPDALGKGSLEGIAAAESANSSVVGGALVPLMTLGIPGDAVTAVLMGAFMIQGLQPGPLLFQNHPGVVYSLLAGFFLADIFLFVIGVFCIRFYVKILRIPILTLCPVILLLCFVGPFSLAGNVFDMIVVLIMGIVGYFLRMSGFPLGPLVIGMILGPLAEVNLRRALTASLGDWSVFVSSPIAVTFLVLTAVSLFLPTIMKKFKG